MQFATIYAEFKLSPENSGTRRAAVELLHLAGGFQPAGPYDGHFLGNCLIRVSPNDFHDGSFLLSETVSIFGSRGQTPPASG